METFQAHPLAIILSVTALVLALVYYLSWKRRKDLEQLAVSLGLPFSPDGPVGSSLGTIGLEIFRQGRSRRATNLIQVQSRAGGISFFDYRYVTGNGKSSQTHTFTLALIACPGCPVPYFELKPESLIYKIGEVFGSKDIDLPAFPLFSDKYRLTGLDEAKAHMFFTPLRAAWFERHQGLRVQGSPGHLVVSRRDGLLPADSWRGFIEDIKAFATEVLR